MEAALGNGDRSRKKKLNVEDFLDFTDDRTLPLTVSQLYQIIGMHGFKKIAARKKTLAEMVSTMELMDLHRSTLLDGGASGDDASLTLKEVIYDLKSLNWRDCHVTSLLTYGATVTPPSPAAVDLAVSPKGKKRPRKKVAAVEVDGHNSAISTNGTTIAAGGTNIREVC